jgi:hypothetical protein
MDAWSFLPAPKHVSLIWFAELEHLAPPRRRVARERGGEKGGHLERERRSLEADRGIDPSASADIIRIKVGDEGRSDTVDGRGTREHEASHSVWLDRAELT